MSLGDIMVNEAEMNKIMRLFERRQKIIRHNNSCVIETVAFYENFLLFHIIKPYFFNNNYDNCEKIKKYMRDRMTLMDRFEIIVDIAKSKKIENFKGFDTFIKMRNEVSHNLSTVNEYNIESKENKVFVGGKESTWDNYLDEIKEWSKLSLDMAKFIMNVYKSINDFDNPMGFHYCKVESKCILVQHNLIFPEPEGDYVSFVFRGLDFDLIQYINEEEEFNLL